MSWEPMDAEELRVKAENLLTPEVRIIISFRCNVRQCRNDTIIVQFRPNLVEFVGSLEITAGLC